MTRVRYVLGLVAFAVFLVWVVQPIVFSHPLPLLSRLDGHDRTELYKQVTAVGAGLLGFLITAVAILVSLDARRRIVEELHRGEAFSLLVVNILAAVLLLFVLSALGVIGSIGDDGVDGANGFESVYEAVLLASLFELALGGFYFALVTYKAATYD